jgi:16S rRNA A1518/A1519 N6-dimethyltransferase RsmA/KsgA/DIM1 with predicted DNA glycosylase/AP lyase activity
VLYAFPVPATSFTPPPKVLSAVIIVEKLASPCLEDALEPRLLQFLDIVSGFKRKTLGKIAKIQEVLFDAHSFFVPEDLC